MSGLLYTLLGLAASSSLHCAVRREISPCTCRQEKFSTPIVVHPVSEASSTLVPGAILSSVASNIGNPDGGVGAGGAASDGGGGGGGGINPLRYPEKISVTCERMESFGQVTDALKGKFTSDQQITLKVQHSQLRDIARHDFKELQMSITRLDLSHDHLR